MLLSARGGKYPSGSTASANLTAAEPGEGLKTGLKAGLQSAMDVASLQKTLEKQESEIALNVAARNSQDADALLKSNSADKVREETISQLIKNQNENRGQKSVFAKQDLEEITAKNDTKAATLDAILNRVLKGSQGLGNILNSLPRSPTKGIPAGPNLTPAQMDYINKTNNYKNLYNK